jgi:hypothetical protein
MQWRNLTSALANGAWLRRRRRGPADKLAPYFQHGFWGRHKILTGLLIAFVSAIYGMMFGVTATAFLVQMMIPVAIVAILVVGLLPESGVVFERSISALFFGFFFALAVWPDYLAFAFGGLPWITAARLIAIPLCLFFLISLSQSQTYRSSMKERLDAAAPVWKFLLVYFVISLITIAFSNKPMESVNKYIVAIYAWGAIFLIAVQLFVRPGRVRLFSQWLWAGLIISCFLAVWEFRIDRVPWAGHIPSFLKIEDEMVARVLSGASRAAIGEHRVQGKFTTPLGLAEFLALMAPFIMHFIAQGRNLIERGAAALTLPLIFFVIDKTDSRLGVIGLLLASFGYVFFWTLRRWQRESSSLFAPMIVVGYPAMMTVLLIASFFVTRLKNMIWGGGAYQASNEAREDQIAQGMDIVMRHPWGHGIGRAAETLGYTNLDGFITIDTYYLSIALEGGVIGFVSYYGAFIAAMVIGSGQLMKAGDREETSWLLPVLLSLGNYVVIKSILSQQENHPLAFCLLGMAVALIYRVKQLQEKAKPEIPQPAG